MQTGILRCALLVLAVTGAGCSDELSPVAPSPPPVVPTVLPPFEPSIAGEYDVTFVAASSCTLPAAVMQRRYIAAVAEPSRGSVTVTLSGAVFRFGLARFDPGFTGTRDGESVRFGIGFGGGRAVAELFDEGTKELSYTGTATGKISAGNISTTFDGQIWVNVAGDLFDWIADCTAADHRIEFVRR